MKLPEPRTTLFVGVLLSSTGCGTGSADEEGEAGPVCGDGIQDSGEGCDDGNRVAGDDCNPQCVPTGTLVECVPLREGSESDEAKALLPLADGTFLVGGNMTLEQGTVERGWVGRFDDSGKQLWFEEIAPLTGEYGKFVDLTTDGSEGAWALIKDEWRATLVHLDGAGKVGAVIDILTALDLPVAAHTVEYGDTGIWIGGESGGDFWLGRYDFASEEVTTVLLEDHVGYNDSIHALGRSETEIAVAATVSTSPNFQGDFEVRATTDILLIRFDLQGNELGRSLSSAEPDSLYTRIALGVAADGEGGWIVGGELTPIGVLLSYHAWATRFDPTPTWEWSSLDILDGDAGAGFGGLLGGEDGVILAGGIYTGKQESAISGGWLHGFALDGTRRWERAHHPAGYEYSEEKLIAREFGGQVRVVGKAWTHVLAEVPHWWSAGPSLLESCLVTQ